MIGDRRGFRSAGTAAKALGLAVCGGLIAIGSLSLRFMPGFYFGFVVGVAGVAIGFLAIAQVWWRYLRERP